MLGGGPAGLAAAWWAARRGLSVILLERAPVVGGLAASFEVAGVRVDHGSHRLHPSIDAAVLADLRSLLGDDLQRRPRRGRLRVAGRWVPFPPAPASLARALPVPVAAALARDLVLAPLRRPRADTYAEVVRAGVGPTLGRHLYHPYARKLWGTEPDQLAGEQARRRIASTSPAAILRRALRGRQGAHFLYPRRGFGQIPDVLAAAAVAAGAEVRTGAAVTGLEVGPGPVRIRLAGGGSVEAAVVLSTIPMAALVGLVQPGPPPEVATAATGQRSRAMVLVYLAVDRAPWTAFDAHYLPDAGVATSRVSEPRNYRDGDDPPDRTVLCAEIPCWPGDGRWGAPDADLVAAAVDDLGRSGLPAVQPSAWEVRRVPSVYPVYRPGFEADLAAVEGWLARFPVLLTLGRQGLFAHDNTHHALSMAYAAVDALGPDGVWNPGAWATARERFTHHVVED